MLSRLLLTLLLAPLVFAGGNHLIIDGVNANKGDYPPVVSLQHYGRHFCGGTLIDRRTVLTAAHCFYGSVIYGITVTAGVTNIWQSDPDRQRAYVTRALVHHSYTSPSQILRGGDIVILKLDSDILPSKTVGYANLPEQNEAPPADQTNCEVVGWGVIDPESQAASNEQMIGRVKLRTNDDCSKIFSHVAGNLNQVCAGGESTTNACEGDSGGPLFCNGKQIGIVSYSRLPCGRNGIPTVYTRVATYTDWIRRFME